MSVSAVCGRGSARGQVLYPVAVAGAQPEPGPLRCGGRGCDDPDSAVRPDRPTPGSVNRNRRALSDTVRCVQMDQARDLVISGSYDTTLKLWELKTGNCIRSLRGHQGPVLAIQVIFVVLPEFPHT